MVLEQFLDRDVVVRHFSFTFALSAVYVFVAFAVQEIFFPGNSLATVLLLTILLVPSIHHLIIMEEKIERTGGKHFWAKHKTIIKSHLGAFLGILVGFLLLGIIDPSTLSYQTAQLQLEHLRPEIVNGFLDKPYAPSMQTAIALFSNNLTYLLMGFVLSLFYGAGAIFLVVFNASYFAAFVVQIITRWAAALQLTAVSLLHLIPESAGFILTAIAGATMSRALLVEKYKAQTFKNVLQSSVKHLIIAILLILLAAFVETFITAMVFHRMLI